MIGHWFRRRTQPAHLRTGEWGERVASRYLRRQGYKVLRQRTRVGRAEIDLIVRRKSLLVFVEVKTRASEVMGRPLTAVDRKKQRLLAIAALRYMRRLRVKPALFRFDVIEVIGTEDAGRPEIRHIENAFNLPPGYRVPW